MVHMKNKCSVLVSEVVLNGKRIIAICGIAVGMGIGNLNCNWFNNLFSSDTTSEEVKDNDNKIDESLLNGL